MSDRGDAGQGSVNDSNSGQVDGTNGDQNSGQSGGTFQLSEAEYKALTKKVSDLEADNYRYRQERRQNSAGGNSSNSGSNDAAGNVSSASHGAANSSGEMAAMRERMRSTNFRAAVAENAAKYNVAESGVLTRVMNMSAYVDEDGNLEDPDTFFKDAKLLYPNLFKTEAPPSINAGDGNNPNSNAKKTFSDTLRDELRAKT